MNLQRKSLRYLNVAHSLSRTLTPLRFPLQAFVRMARERQAARDDAVRRRKQLALKQIAAEDTAGAGSFDFNVPSAQPTYPDVGRPTGRALHYPIVHFTSCRW